MKTSGLIALVLALGLGFTAAGCVSSPFDPKLRQQVVPGLGLAQVRGQAGLYSGQTVLWGGRVIESRNLKDQTQVEILQQPLYANDRPAISDQTQGRFLALAPGYLDVEIYKAGREVSVIGQVLRAEDLPLGQTSYRYVIIRADKIILWPKRPKVTYVYPQYIYYPPGAIYLPRKPYRRK